MCGDNTLTIHQCIHANRGLQNYAMVILVLNAARSERPFEADDEGIKAIVESNLKYTTRADA